MSTSTKLKKIWYNKLENWPSRRWNSSKNHEKSNFRVPIKMGFQNKIKITSSRTFMLILMSHIRTNFYDRKDENRRFDLSRFFLLEYLKTGLQNGSFWKLFSAKIQQFLNGFLRVCVTARPELHKTAKICFQKAINFRFLKTREHP